MGDVLRRPSRFLELRHLRYVEAAARHRTFTTAGAELSLCQPVISRHIGDLEAELGVRLFERLLAGVTPTLAGEAFVLTARHVLDQVRELLECLTENGVRAGGRLRVGATHALASGRLRTALANLRQFHAEIAFDLTERQTGEPVAELHARRLDVAIVAGAPRDRSDLDVLPLAPEPIMIALPETHPLAERNSIGWGTSSGNQSSSPVPIRDLCSRPYSCSISSRGSESADRDAGCRAGWAHQPCRCWGGCCAPMPVRHAPCRGRHRLPAGARR